jgi:hypothetical protein
MADLNRNDFYFGAVLSQLLGDRKEHNPVYLESGKRKRVYSISVNKWQYFLSMHYRTYNPGKEAGNGCSVTLSQPDIEQLRKYRNDGKWNVVAWIFIDKDKPLQRNKIVFITDVHIERKGCYEQTMQRMLRIKEKGGKNDYSLVITENHKRNDLPIKTTIAEALKYQDKYMPPESES